MESYRQITLAVLLKTVVLILFVVPMIILMIINAYRVFWIRIWAIISPFIVLNVIFKPTINNDKVNKFFSLKNIIGLIFQPVIVVGALALSMILIV